MFAFRDDVEWTEIPTVSTLYSDFTWRSRRGVNCHLTLLHVSIGDWVTHRVNLFVSPLCASIHEAQTTLLSSR